MTKINTPLIHIDFNDKKNEINGGRRGRWRRGGEAWRTRSLLYRDDLPTIKFMNTATVALTHTACLLRVKKPA